MEKKSYYIQIKKHEQPKKNDKIHREARRHQHQQQQQQPKMSKEKKMTDEDFVMFFFVEIFFFSYCTTTMKIKLFNTKATNENMYDIRLMKLLPSTD